MPGRRGRGEVHDRDRGRENVRGTRPGRGFSQRSRAQHSGGMARSPSANDQEMNWDLPERFRNGRRQNYSRNSDRQSTAWGSNLDVTLNTDIRDYMQTQSGLRSDDLKEQWINAPEIPKRSEVHLADGTTINLAPNKIDTKFKSVRNYLKTHYNLLREDALGPLRDAIDEFRTNPQTEDNANLSVYEKVYIRGFTFTNMGIAARLKFSTKRAGRKIMWSASKRLVSGSLVALTPADDNFHEKCIMAIIAARPLELLECSPPEVDVYFSCPEDIQIDPQIGYIMLEAKQGYFEAYRHTLKAMQKLSCESSPLCNLVLGSEMEIGPPQYLTTWPDRSLAAALDTNSDNNESLASVDIINRWPETSNGTALDQSQWDALQQILTKKLAIIQGPPGTGKTYVSKTALQIMVQNRADGDPPIIIAAQTNHALDQLLIHVSKFDPEYVRLGGRSTNAEIKRRALYEIRQRESIPPVPGSLLRPARNRLEREQAKYGELLSIFGEDMDVIPAERLLQLGVINASQHTSIIDAANNWITTEDNNLEPMQYWLHKQLVPFEVFYDDDSFGFDEAEEDLEIEQLREVEAEHGLADEEDIEMLQGPWRAIHDKWTVAMTSEAEIEKAKHMLDTTQDLWRIPEHLRGTVYAVMKKRAKDITLAKFRQEAREYQKIVEELKIGRWEKDAVFLKRANIIGMTTTGLSKYRPLIASLHPKIVLVEEAAEVIEGPVAVACMESVEHLILVGDHKQLQGHCALQELEDDPFYLNVSMFERLINLGLPYKTLLRQRRMIPEIRQLISSLYPSLDDHDSIQTRQQPPPWGTGLTRSFFFHHDWSELKDQSLSTYNEEEARMVAKFYRHLLRNGVPPDAITILTFYNGQRKRILRELKNDSATNFAYNNVKTVDSYQGEENEIIILSLVRSNTHGQIGFLEIDNRVCVALSRARNGFYIFGNGYLLSEKSELWSNVGKLMSESDPPRFGTQMTLTCINHNNTTIIRWPDDFDNNDGGCDILCATERKCGHVCQRRCHAMTHDKLPCEARCGKVLSCGHQCHKSCHEICFCGCETSAPTFYDGDGLEHEARSKRKIDKGRTLDGDELSVGLRSPGRALARGGAAFRPLSNATSAYPTCVGDPQSWVSFIDQEKRDNNGSREQTRTTQSGGTSDDPPEASLQQDRAATVQHLGEEKIKPGRSRFHQAYHPASRGKNKSAEAPLTQQQASDGQMTAKQPNLMD